MIYSFPDGSSSSLASSRNKVKRNASSTSESARLTDSSGIHSNDYLYDHDETEAPSGYMDAVITHVDENEFNGPDMVEISAMEESVIITDCHNRRRWVAPLVVDGLMRGMGQGVNVWWQRWCRISRDKFINIEQEERLIHTTISFLVQSSTENLIRLASSGSKMSFRWLSTAVHTLMPVMDWWYIFRPKYIRYYMLARLFISRPRYIRNYMLARFIFRPRYIDPS